MIFKILVSKWCDRIYHMWSTSSAFTTVFWVSRDNVIADSLSRWVWICKHISFQSSSNCCTTCKVPFVTWRASLNPRVTAAKRSHDSQGHGEINEYDMIEEVNYSCFLLMGPQSRDINGPNSPRLPQKRQSLSRISFN